VSRRNFRDALEEYERGVGSAALPVDVDRKVRERLRERSHRRSPRRALALVALGATGAALAAAVLLIVFRDRGSEGSRVGGLLVADATPTFRAVVAAHTGVVDIRSGRATLVDEDLHASLVVRERVQLRRRRGLEIMRGTVVVRVDKRRPRQAPAELRVSHGRIQVMGTRFTVVQGPTRGHVTLHEGAIRFASDDGRSVAVRVGETLGWPLPQERRPVAREVREGVIAPPPRDRGPRRESPQPPPQTFEAIQQRIAALRSRGRYEEAVREIAGALDERSYSQRARETLSFELGSMLTNQLADRQRACAHWARHLRRYERGRYAVEIAQARRRLRCTPP